MADDDDASASIFKPESSFDLEKLTASFAARGSRWSFVEAILALLLSAASAKGTTTPESEIEVHALARTSRVLKSLTPEQLGAINTRISRELKGTDAEIKELCETVPPDMRLTVLAQCAGIILADGDLMKLEADFLNRITAYFGINTEDAKRVMEVMLVKHKY
jgi:uncharacterized tellurite resistance protein B-like protein